MFAKTKKVLGWVFLSSFRSAARNVGSSVGRLKELHDRFADPKPGPWAGLSFEECYQRRPANALPLERLAWQYRMLKRVAILAMVVTLCCVAVFTWSYSGPRRFIPLASLPWACLFWMAAMKWTLRLQQIRERRLFGFREFVSQPGWIWKVLDLEF